MAKWYKRIVSVITYNIIVLLVYIIAMPQQALGLPAPMSRPDLINNSDIFAKVHILEIDRTTNTAIAQYDRVGTTAINSIIHDSISPKYTGPDGAPLKVITICWPDLPKNLIGPWSIRFTENEDANVYLKWIGKKDSQQNSIWHLYHDLENCYAATWWNAKIPDDKVSPTIEANHDQATISSKEAVPHSTLELCTATAGNELVTENVSSCNQYLGH